MSADFRRRHTKNFTTIGNALFDDERLAADEVGILAYLLSKPHDWQIRRAALGRRWGFKRDAMRRIIRSWLRTGWIHCEKIRLDNGRFHITYEICDEPGPELSEDEITKVLSLVSSEPDGDVSKDGDTTGPVTGQPPLAEPPPADPPLVCYKDLPNTDSPNTESTNAPPLWRDIRALWPPQELRSPSKCEQLFAALSPADRQKAVDGVGPYLDNCRASDRKLCDLSTYLKERRFTGSLSIPTTTFAIHGGTAQAFRWLDYRMATNQPTTYMVDCWRHKKPWYAPTEWPPPLPVEAKKAG